MGPLAGKNAKSFTCPTCGARVGKPCRDRTQVGKYVARKHPHAERVKKMTRAQNPKRRPDGNSVSSIPSAFETNRSKH